MKIAVLVILLLLILEGDSEENPYVKALKVRQWSSIQDYVEVRPGAFMFYWLYFADGTKTGADHKPLVVWIQGGPGLAASGVANFAEIGPLNMNMEPRNHTWVKGRNLLLFDHPVGVGFSYVKDNSLLVKTDRQIATDLARAIKVFLKRHKEFRKTPTYIFGQSYGGKICPRLAFYLHTAIKRKSLKMNFKGIGIGSGWVDPKESTLMLPEYLYSMGYLDQNAYWEVRDLSWKYGKYIDKKDYTKAALLDDLIFKLVNDKAGTDINFNNINQVSPYPSLEELEKKVNKYVKPTLFPLVNQSLDWSYDASHVWWKLNSELVVPSHKFVELILNTTALNVAVYNGNLDVVTPLAGASNWVHKLKWAGAQEFKNAERFLIHGKSNGMYKKARTLSFWSVFGSGHWVPEDNPVAMQEILKFVTHV